MKSFFWVLAILFAIYLHPISILFAILAIGTSPGGYRRDGRRRKGGLINAFFDYLTDIAYDTKYYKYARGFEFYTNFTLLLAILILIVVGFNY